MGSTEHGPAWAALAAHRRATAGRQLRELFAADAGRAARFAASFEDLHLDFSKNDLDDTGFGLLLELARERGVEKAILEMFAGEPINFTENRAVLHTALRNPGTSPVLVGDRDVVPDVHAVLERIAHFSERVRSGEWLGFSGEPIRDVVNIGIGGSHLGPRMVTTALGAYAKPGLRSHFVANVDGADIAATLAQVDPRTTLFIVASKSFTTQETMTNAGTARRWFLDQGGSADDIGKHFVAVSTNGAAVAEFGIDTANMFEFWDWVGGRYSLWSAIGLPIVLSIGIRRFRELLAGAHAMDEHFRTTPLERNWPVILAMLGIWYVNFRNLPAHAILPYAECLRWLPEYLQQADMESNGKRTRLDGTFADYPTGPVIWGSPGTNGQHAYFQLLHQGTRIVPADFIAVVNPPTRIGRHHDLLLANCLAQSEALMLGRDRDATAAELRGGGAGADEVARLAPHRTFPGNRPSNTILMKELTPRNLGILLALYEHKIFVQGVVWQINSFDQWGVELGKQLADGIYPELTGTPDPGRNPSTAALLDFCRRHRNDP